MELLNDTKNELMKRREIQGVIRHEGNPGLEHVKKSLSENFKTQIDNIAIKSLKNNFGANDFLVEAFIYESPEHKNLVEPKQKAKKVRA